MTVLTLYWSWLIATQQREYQQCLPLFDISSGFSFHFLFISLCHTLKLKKQQHTSLKPTLLKKKTGLIIYLLGQNKGVQEYSWEEATIFRLVCYWAIGQAGVGRGSILGLNGRTACERPSAATHRQNRQLCELLISIKSIPKYLAAF